MPVPRPTNRNTLPYGLFSIRANQKTQKIILSQLKDVLTIQDDDDKQLQEETFKKLTCKPVHRIEKRDLPKGASLTYASLEDFQKLSKVFEIWFVLSDLSKEPLKINKGGKIFFYLMCKPKTTNSNSISFSNRPKNPETPENPVVVYVSISALMSLVEQKKQKFKFFVGQGSMHPRGLIAIVFMQDEEIKKSMCNYKIIN